MFLHNLPKLFRLFSPVIAMFCWGSSNKDGTHCIIGTIIGAVKYRMCVFVAGDVFLRHVFLFPLVIRRIIYEENMLRISMCLLFTVALMSGVFAQGQRDVQSLQYEFGRVASVKMPVAPCPCEKPIYAPVGHPSCCCPPVNYCVPVVYPVCRPYYTAPYPVKYRRAVVVRPGCSPYYCW